MESPGILLLSKYWINLVLKIIVNEKLYVENVLQIASEEINYQVDRHTNGYTCIIEKRKIKGFNQHPRINVFSVNYTLKFINGKGVFGNA